MTTTALNIIKQSLRNLGVLAQGETPPAAEAMDALDVLNQMLDRFSNELTMVYHITTSLYDVTPNVSTYTLGPNGSGATWECGTRRPIMYEKWAAFVRQTVSSTNLTNDYKLAYMPTTQYQNLFLKGTPSNFPQYFTVEYGWPIITIRLFPVPTQTLKFSLSTYDQFDKFALSDYVDLPPGYESMLIANLSLDLAPQYGVEPGQNLIRIASESKARLQTTNSDMIVMELDRALVPHNSYNIYAG